MRDLEKYLRTIVEPTVDEFRKSRISERHAFLACVALYHSIDRAAYPQKARVLNQKWHAASPAFALVDVIAHDFKHVRSRRKAPVSLPRGSPALFGTMGFNTQMFNDTGRRYALVRLVSVIDEALEFVWRQAGHNGLILGRSIGKLP